MSLKLTLANHQAAAWLFVGLRDAHAPFKGGVLVPSPDGVSVGLHTNPLGNLALDGSWPAGLPSGRPIYFQFWILDPVGPQGLSASNALAAFPP